MKLMHSGMYVAYTNLRYLYLSLVLLISIILPTISSGQIGATNNLTYRTSKSFVGPSLLIPTILGMCCTKGKEKGVRRL
ncbi:hypothetical protein F5X96DRAFT_640594 [Biscogniauxia mediterranea]|nr:hypothetical protein F5X96DRAFT_640594 [Biscogniauxia mediterranea]